MTWRCCGPARSTLSPGSFDWNLLVAPPNVTGEDRLDEQYLRANVDPSERYVLSVPGSGEHRIAPDDTGLLKSLRGRRLDGVRDRRRLRGGGGHFWDAGC